MDGRRIHETEPEQETLYRSPNEYYVDEQLRPMQTIERGGPPRKADLSAMPLPLRIFGYFFYTVIIMMGLAFAFVSLFR